MLSLLSSILILIDFSRKRKKHSAFYDINVFISISLCIKGKGSFVKYKEDKYRKKCFYGSVLLNGYICTFILNLVRLLRERVRDRKRERERKKDRQTDKMTDTQPDR